MTPGRLASVITRNTKAVIDLARASVPPLSARSEGVNEVQLALVSNPVPQLTVGWALVLERLLGNIDPAKLLIVGPGAQTWEPRPRVRLYSDEAHLLSLPSRERFRYFALEQELKGAVRLARRLPRLRRILATMDEYLAFACVLAEETGAELWIWAIDDHTMNDSPFIQRWRARAFKRASRIFGVTDEMGSHMQARYGIGPVETLYITRDIPDRVPPLPQSSRRRIVFSGTLVGYHREPMEAMAAHYRDRADAPELVAIAPARSIAETPWKPSAPWQLRAGDHDGGASEVAAAHLGLVILNPSERPEDGMNVAFPTKMQEYSAFGRATVALAPRVSCVSRLIESERLGWCAYETHGFLRALDEACEASDDVLRETGLRARAFAERELDLKKRGADFVRAFVA